MNAVDLPTFNLSFDPKQKVEKYEALSYTESFKGPVVDPVAYSCSYDDPYPSFWDRMGSVYVLTNAAMPGLVKIGRTFGSVTERAAALSKATGVPMPFTVALEVRCMNCIEVERELHLALAKCRASSAREFFLCSLESVVELVAMMSEDEVRIVQTGRAGWFVPVSEGGDTRSFQ